MVSRNRVIVRALSLSRQCPNGRPRVLKGKRAWVTIFSTCRVHRMTSPSAQLLRRWRTESEWFEEYFVDRVRLAVWESFKTPTGGLWRLFLLSFFIVLLRPSPASSFFVRLQRSLSLSLSLFSHSFFDASTDLDLQD